MHQDLKIEGAREILVFEVQQRHVDKGERHNSLSCPTALALREQTGEACCVWTYLVTVGQDPYTPSYELTGAICEFDRTGKFPLGFYMLEKA